MIDEFKRHFDLAKGLRPVPRRIMASPLVPWPHAYRQWRSDGELILWVNAEAITRLPSKPERPVHMLDSFISIDAFEIPVEFV